MDKKDLLIDYINGGLSAEETRRLRESLLVDEDLRHELDAIRREQHEVQNALNSTSDRSRKAITDAVKQRLSRSRKERSKPKTATLLATAAALLLALLIVLQTNTNAPASVDENPGVSLVLSTDDPGVTIYWTVEAE